MIYIYEIHYYAGDDDSFGYKTVQVHSAQNNSISGVTFTPMLPSASGGSEYNTGTTKRIKYVPVRESTQNSLGISWYVNEPIIRKWSTSTWSAGIGSRTLVRLSDLAWSNSIEGNVSRFVHKTFRVSAGDYIRLSLPSQYEWNGFYSTSDIKYLTVDYGYNKDPEKISLNGQVYSRVKVRSWFSGEGDELTPGSSIDVTESELVSTTIYGPYSSITYHTRSDAKTYQQLLSSIDTTRPNEDSSFQVSLKSNPENFHNSETLNVSAYKTYQFNKWKTSSGDLNLSNKPSTSNVTVYADWTNTGTVVETSLPQWTTTQKLQSGSTSLTLKCFKESTDTSPYFTKTVNKYELKPAKHVRWKVGSTNYSIGTVVTEGAGTTYTAVWEVDSSGTSTYQITDNVVTLPVPTKSNYSLVGWQNDSGVVYNGSYTITSNVNLYALWKLNAGTVEIYNSTTKKFEKYQIVIYNESTGEWDRYIPKIGNGSDWSDTYM